jgi:hypothetical protein
VRLASRGQRDMDGGAAAIDDAGELAQVRRQARRVRLQTVIVAVVVAVLLVLLP